mgnify:FL=1
MEGCELYGSCLECRFARCVYDKPRGKRQKLKKMRDRKVVRLFHRGKDTRELARRFGVSRRTVQRVIKENTKSEYRNTKQVTNNLCFSPLGGESRFTPFIRDSV